MDDWNPEEDQNSCFDEKTLREMLDFIAPTYMGSEPAIPQCGRRDSVSSDFENIENKSMSTSSSALLPPLPSLPKLKHKKVSHKVSNLKEKKLFLNNSSSHAAETITAALPLLPPLEIYSKEGDKADKKFEDPLNLVELTWDLSVDPREVVSKEDAEPTIEALSSCSARQKREAVSEIKARVSAIEESISLAKNVLSKLMRPQS